MDVFTLAKACLRRWYIFIPLLAIVAVVSVIQGRGIKPQYSKSAYLVLVAPNKVAISGSGSGVTVPTNPLNGVGGVQAVLQVRVNGPAAAADVARVAGGSFFVTAQKQGNILVVAASAPSASATATTLDAGVKEVSVQLSELQKSVNAPASTYVTASLQSTDGGVAVSYPHRGRNITIVAAGGALLSILLVQLIDFGMLAAGRRRAASRHRKTVDEDLSQPEYHAQPGYSTPTLNRTDNPIPENN